ncbi:hypothetical protein [Aequorivita capsosiphonis]|uniref:hypothetical protein n=1 Tax=Aequorivita capsosiphonis TaxID=487317 RepID=UPI00047D4761|nr:hypothetical protein [Aequorivita capsosiphonis]
MGVTIKMPLTFEICFPDEEQKPIDYYLKDLAKDMRLLMGSFLLGIKNRGSEFSGLSGFLPKYFSQANYAFAQSVHKRIIIYAEENDFEIDTFEVVYPLSSLVYFEYVYDNPAEFDNKEYSSEEFLDIEINFFKAYTIFNQQTITERGKVLAKNFEEYNIDSTLDNFFVGNHLHSFDITDYQINKVFLCQFLKAYSFFEFSVNFEGSNHLLKSFYHYYEVADFKEYLHKLLGIIYPVLTAKKEAHIEIHLDADKQEELSLFIEKHIKKDAERLSDFDFTKTRSYPLYKFEEGKYRIIYPLFAVEMIYKGLYFRFKDRNEVLPKDQQLKNLYGIKNLQFSEQYLLSQTLEKIFGNRFMQRSGKELDANFKGAPDYYVRNGKKIFLFESKDVLLGKEIKQSTQYNEILEKLKITFVENENGKPKAVLQLIDTIEDILTKSLAFDVNAPSEKAIIYPILVVHYRMFNTPGINKIINGWFTKALLEIKEKGLYIANIKNLVIIDMDTLIYNSHFFETRKLDLDVCLLEYHHNYLNLDLKQHNIKSQQQADEMISESYASFAHYLDNKIDNTFHRPKPKELIAKMLSVVTK